MFPSVKSYHESFRSSTQHGQFPISIDLNQVLKSAIASPRSGMNKGYGSSG